MGRVYRKLIIIFILLCGVVNTNVYAEEEDTTCNWSSKAKLNEAAYKVEASYTIKKDDSGSYYFDISIYNISDEIYITIENDITDDIIYVGSTQTTNNTYTFSVNDYVTIINYTIRVKALKYGCSNEIRKFTLTKPRYNDLSELAVCKNQIMTDYSYCQPWVTNYFTSTREEIIEKINSQYAKSTTTTSSICVSCENIDRINEKIEKFNNLRKKIIIGLIAGIAADIVIIIFLYIRIRRYSI